MKTNQFKEMLRKGNKWTHRYFLYASEFTEMLGRFAYLLDKDLH